MVVCARQLPHFRLMALLPAQYKAHESPEPRNGDHPGRVRSGAQTLDGSPVPCSTGNRRNLSHRCLFPTVISLLTSLVATLN